MGVVTFFYYFVGGVGVRERSRYAAAVVFVMYFLDTLMTFGVVRILFSALLLSNLRATWIAASWKPESEEAILPPRLNESLADKHADQLPAWLWPKLRIVYYVYSVGFLVLVAAGLTVLATSPKLN
jgi:hypothetical protein